MKNFLWPEWSDSFEQGNFFIKKTSDSYIFLLAIKKIGKFWEVISIIFLAIMVHEKEEKGNHRRRYRETDNSFKCKKATADEFLPTKATEINKILKSRTFGRNLEPPT